MKSKFTKKSAKRHHRNMYTRAYMDDRYMDLCATGQVSADSITAFNIIGR